MKTDEELLREVHYDKVHRRAIGRHIAMREKTPDFDAESSMLEGDTLGSFGVQPSEGEN